MPETPQAELPFERLGEYTVLAPISEGGMASVWLGCATEEPNRFAALKVIRAEHGRNKEFVAMFLDEARIASRLSHPNIIAIHGLGHDGKRHFLAMEVLRGRTLLEIWERAHAQKRRLPYEVVAWIGARVADALHHAHELRDERGRPLPRHSPRRQPLEHLPHRRGGSQAHRLRSGEGARPHRLDGHRGDQGKARVPRAGAGAGSLARIGASTSLPLA